MLVGGHVHGLGVLPGHQSLVILVQHLRGSPQDILVLQILLGNDGDAVKPVLADSASSASLHLRQLVQERKTGKEVVEEYLRSRCQPCSVS